MQVLFVFRFYTINIEIANNINLRIPFLPRNLENAKYHITFVLPNNNYKYAKNGCYNMNNSQLKSILTETVKNPQIITGIHNYCNRWCERCTQTSRCSAYQTNDKLPADNEDFAQSISQLFEATLDMLHEYAEKYNISLDFSEEEFAEYEKERERIDDIVQNSAAIVLVKQYRNQVRKWLDLRNDDESVVVEIRLQDPMLADCLEVIQWYQTLLEVKLMRALKSKMEEERLQFESFDSLPTAKLLLVSIDRNIGAWGYLYQKFKDSEDEILEILVCLQRLSKEIEQVFPDARNFVREGLDE